MCRTRMVYRYDEHEGFPVLSVSQVMPYEYVNLVSIIHPDDRDAKKRIWRQKETQGESIPLPVQ